MYLNTSPFEPLVFWVNAHTVKNYSSCSYYICDWCIIIQCCRWLKWILRHKYTLPEIQRLSTVTLQVDLNLTSAGSSTNRLCSRLTRITYLLASAPTRLNSGDTRSRKFVQETCTRNLYNRCTWQKLCGWIGRLCLKVAGLFLVPVQETCTE